MRGAGLLTALAIVVLAATPGVVESYAAWQEYPTARGLIVSWYAAVLALALAIGAGLGGLNAGRAGA